MARLALHRSPYLDPDRPRDDVALVAAAATALDHDTLRAFVREWAEQLDDRERTRFRDALVSRTTRSVPSFAAPSHGDARLVADVDAFVAAARASSHAEPVEIEALLDRVGRVFLSGDYAAARHAYEHSLAPFVVAEVHTGEDEHIQEVLHVELYDVVARLLVCAYETTPLAERPAAVIATLHRFGELGYVSNALPAMERVALKPLSELEAFLPLWIAHLGHANRDEPAQHGAWESDVQRMLRDAVERKSGADGLGRLAESLGTYEAFAHWASSLADAGRWDHAQAALARAAERMSSPHHRASFLDAAAHVALHRADPGQATRSIEAALAASPSLVRLRRFLAPLSGEELEARARALAAAHPDWSHRLRTVLALLAGDVQAPLAASSEAPSEWNGWQSVTPIVFASLLVVLAGAPPSGSARAAVVRPITVSDASTEPEALACIDLGLFEREPSAIPLEGLPRVPAPSLVALLERVWSRRTLDDATRASILATLEAMARRRVDEVTSTRHRSRYDEAARLVAACAEAWRVTGEPATADHLLDDIASDHPRKRAFRDALRRAAGARAIQGPSA